MKPIDLTHYLTAKGGTSAIQLHGAVRHVWSHNSIDLLRDDFAGDGATCLFTRIHADTASNAILRLAGNHRLRRCNGLGGWLLEPDSKGEAVYWMPRPPMLRTFDDFGRITTEKVAPLADFTLGGGETSVSLAIEPGQVLDWAIWKLNFATFDAVSANPSQELLHTLSIERQPFFIYASHTTIRGAADFYQHLVHGRVYGACWAWPKKRKICDELDALALHLIAVALERATGKRIYRLLRRQIVLSVLHRQDENGGFRHGEWTDQYESHNRLINGAAQLLASEFELAPEPTLSEALKRATTYIAMETDQTAVGAWLLHDSLERTEEGMRHYPFAWAPGRWMDKSPTNLLILNTHVDGMLTLARYHAVSGDESHNALFRSAEACLRALMSAHPADWLFRPLLAIIKLSLLPKAEQERLPLATRALKRLGWRYLIPRWHRILQRFPRLLMPTGYIERSLGQAGFGHRYHGVHLMDFERMLGCVAVDAHDPQLTAISDSLVEFGVVSRITLHWKENAASKDSLGFWAEGLYRRCLRTGADEDRALLATAVLDLHDAGLGLPPSLLGANGETVPLELATPTPSPTDERLRVVNLSDQKGACFLVINTGTVDVPLTFETAAWHSSVNFSALKTRVAARNWTVLSIASRDCSAPKPMPVGANDTEQCPLGEFR